MDELSDISRHKPVLHSRMLHRGVIIDYVEDEIDLGHNEVVRREYVKHPGAVAIIVLDDQDRILLQRQYRHSVRSELWEPPAGLLDVDAELPLDAACRELAEEADLRAGQWHHLVDYLASPGCLDEAVRIYLARDVIQIPVAERFERVEEERNMRTRWVTFSEAEEAIFSGKLRSPSALVGILATLAAHRNGWQSLRPPNAPWPA